jgi:membrane fusion protein (multidrug efflux system)
MSSRLFVPSRNYIHKKGRMKSVHFILLLVMTGLAGCFAKGSEKVKEKELVLPVLQLGYVDTVLHKSYVANINACQNVELRAKASGFLEEILVDEGQYVRKGQLLFHLNDDELKVQMSEATAFLSSARAEAKAAEVEKERVKTLVNKNVVSPSELDLAKARLAAANAKVQEAMAREQKARIRLSYASVRAPFDGIIDRIPHKLGSLIAEGNLLTTVSDIHAMHAYFNVSEREYLNFIKNGQTDTRFNTPVSLVLADGSVYGHQGRIETMEGQFQQGTGSIAFRARFPNPSHLLKHGASGKILLTSVAKHAMMIPQKAVFEIQDRNYVFVIDKDNTVKMKSFEPDVHVEDFILVKSGLSDKDRIIYEGVQNVKEGYKIVPRLMTMDSLLIAQRG